jgi:hypothetical protein
VIHRGRRLQASLLSLALFLLNVWICARLFRVEFTHLESNAAALISIGRFFQQHWRDLRWFPWFDGGMPIENAYQPVLPAVTAILSSITGLSLGRAFHAILAFSYCLGPVTLFWFVADWSGSLKTGFFAGLSYSLVSPAPMLIPEIRVHPLDIWAPQRLYNLVRYGEGPHNLALTLLPIAFLCLRRAIVRRTPASFAAAIVACAAVALSNALGAMSLAIGALLIALALRRGFPAVALIGGAAWLWSSPWLSPSLIATMRRTAFSAGGFFHDEPSRYAALGILLATTALLAWALRKRPPFERFAAMFSLWMCALPLADFGLHVTLVPQGTRYQLDMEMALAMVFACLVTMALRSPRAVQAVLIAALAAGAVHQARAYRGFARSLIVPVDISQTVEYKVASWVARNLPGQRAMISGDAAYVFNLVADNPQLSAGHEPTAPNFMQQIVVYAIYTGMNAGARDAEVCIFWMKAFGTQAITVPGPNSTEFYKPFVNAGKFEGVLPVLWRADGDTIYGVPQRSHSLAYVIPKDAIVPRQPVNSLDLDPARAYVRALDDNALPGASLQWSGPSRATIRTTMTPAQAISVQVTGAAGWRATVGGRKIPVRRDGLGQLILDPGCNGNCVVDLYYGTTPEVWFCRMSSALVTLALLGAAAFRKVNWHL